MGNQHSASHPSLKPRKNVHWKSAGRPAAPGRPDIIPILSDEEPNAITLRWSPSAHDGGAPLQGYQVECNRLGSAEWVRTAPPVVQRPELVLSGLDPPHRYQFRVAAVNAVGRSDYSELSDVLNVGADRPHNEPPAFYQHLSDITALENEKTEFRVSFGGIPAPTISWFKDDYEIFSSRRTAITTTESSSVLVFHQTLPSDDGEIKCTATNRVGHAVSKARLSLEAAPKLRYPRQYEDGLLYEINETVFLKTSIVGKPTPTVEWRHDGQPIAVDDRVEISNTPKFSMLKIHTARRSDRGEYQVHASNSIGEDTAAFLVTITAPPDPPRRVSVARQVDKSVTLDWQPPEDDGGCRIGNYVVEYYRAGWNVWLKATTSRRTNVTLFDLIEGSEYRFRVKAESPYGMSAPSADSAPVRIPGRSVDMEFLAVESRIINEVLTKEDGAPVSVSPAPRRKRAAAPPSPQPKRRAITPEKDPTGSNEFMLVLYPDKKRDEKADRTGTFTRQESTSASQEETTAEKKRRKKLSKKRKSFQLELEDALSPPPLSLSAPELSARSILPFKALRNAVSSTELLHERAMARFYKAIAMQEEHDKIQPKQNIPYKHDATEPINKQKPPEIFVKTDSVEDREYKFTPHQESYDSNASTNKWLNMSFDEDYTASTVSSEEDFSDVGSLNGERGRQFLDDEDTYNPRDKTARPSPSKEYLEEEEEESEKMLKPLPLPDPNFVPKPILKRRELEPGPKTVGKMSKTKEKQAFSPQVKAEEKHTFGPQLKTDDLFGSTIKHEERHTFGPQTKIDEKRIFGPQNMDDKIKAEPQEIPKEIDTLMALEPKLPDKTKIDEKKKSKEKLQSEKKSDIFEMPKQEEKMTLFKKITKMPVQKPSFSLPKILQKKEAEKPLSKNDQNDKPKEHNKVEKVKDQITEEGRTVIEYYDNIVREYKSNKKPSTPLYLNTEDLKHVAEEQQEKREQVADQNKLLKQNKTSANKPAAKSKTGNSIRQAKPKQAYTTQQKPRKREKPVTRKAQDKQNDENAPEKYTQQIVLKTTERATIVIPIDYQELEEKAKVNVRSAIDYMVDVCLLMLAFWVYFFKDERLAIPFLILIIYRQLQETLLYALYIPEWVRTHTPSWLKKKAS